LRAFAHPAFWSGCVRVCEHEGAGNSGRAPAWALDESGSAVGGIWVRDGAFFSPTFWMADDPVSIPHFRAVDRLSRAERR
jgi:hypothetical protein